MSVGTTQPAQGSELAEKLMEFAGKEREYVPPSLDLDTQRHVVADPRRHAADAAEKNSRMSAAIEARREELDLRESRIAEREALVAAQLEDMRSRFAEFNRCDSSSIAKVPTTDLRSDLAELFGLQKPAAESEKPPLPPAAFVDLSEPRGKRLSAEELGSDSAQQAVRETMEVRVDYADPACEQTSDDFVRDYMKQLLLRNRKTGDTPLPVGSKATAQKKDPATDSADRRDGATLPKSPPKVKSYIEQYMAENKDAGEPSVTSGLNTESEGSSVFDVPRPVHVRPKIDLLKLREHMESFRVISSLSAEKALASHALKVGRLGFCRRMLFAALLILSTVLLGVATRSGALHAPMLVWVIVISAIAVVFELFQQYRAIAVHSRNPLDH